MSQIVKPVIPEAMKPGYDRFQFAPATQVETLLILSGQLGLDADGAPIADLEAQFTAAFESVGLILREAGCTFDDVVELVTFHIGLQSHLSTFMAVKATYIKEPFPSWTAIGITELAVPGAVVEIKATAVVRN